MSADDQLADIICDQASERTAAEQELAQLFAAVMLRARDEYDGEADLVIATLRAAGWRPPARTVSTVEELADIAVGALLRSDRTGNVWWRETEKPNLRWIGSGGAYSLDSDFIRLEGPLTVLFEGGA